MKTIHIQKLSEECVVYKRSLRFKSCLRVYMYYTIYINISLLLLLLCCILYESLTSRETNTSTTLLNGLRKFFLITRVNRRVGRKTPRQRFLCGRRGPGDYF